MSNPIEYTPAVIRSLLNTLIPHKSLVLPVELQRKLGIIYSGYRLIISLFLFMGGYILVIDNNNLSVTLPSFLEQTTLLFYSLFSLLLLAFLVFVKQSQRQQLSLGLVLDVIVLSLLLYINGAADVQLTMLYAVVVAVSFMLLVPYQALIITMLAVILVIYQQFFYALSNDLSADSLSSALLLSLSFICVAFLSWSISQRLAVVEQIASNNAAELAKLHEINHEVISKMRHGVLVFNSEMQLVLSNQAALFLLNLVKLPKNNPLNLPVDYANYLTSKNSTKTTPDKRLYQNLGKALKHYHPKLQDLLASTSSLSQSQLVYHPPIHDTANNATQNTNKLRLSTVPTQDGSMLVLIEDIHREQSHAQQLKLASLGQLTASIAHEIRNPLATISQASQLLLEDDIDASSNPNIELYKMIYQQTKRVNQIIEDVLKLSRQAKPTQKKLDIARWTEQFIKHHFNEHDIFITYDCHPSVYFDVNQLEQVLTNLIQNGLRYSSKAHPHAFVELEIYCHNNVVILDVLDGGQGVKEQHIDNLFMPFFTTEHEGTGLGLYLCQAFAEANHARIFYIPDHAKTCFRLQMPLAELQPIAHHP